MIITMRPCAGEADLRQVAELARSFPDEQLHVADLPYRLASWALESERNARLWCDSAGALLAFAIIQMPWQTLDYFVHPAARQLGVETAIMVWVAERMQEIAAERGEAVTLFVNVREGHRDRITVLAQHGFAPASWTVVHLARPLLDVIPEPQLPPGFSLRRLDGEREVPDSVRLHRAAFGTNHMTIPWRRRTLRAPEYIPELDIVAVAPNGNLAAFCVCWLNPAARQGQVEPLGVHPEYQALGLGRAVLLEGLWRLQAHGAEEALVHTYEDDTAAVRLYTRAGFRQVYRTATFARTFV
ncbi:MAG TPA: N-acetyltransferase [Roseiflexaceae bacterium]|nr:N-acetyltransferase [Roseiflexaceae bacterium]